MKNTICFTICLLLINISVNAQITFSPETISGSYNGPDPVSFFTADLDGDNAKDIIVSTWPLIGDNQIYWFKNMGKETFERRILSDNYGSVYITGVDFDKDGDIDIVSLGGDIVWIENKGNGEFKERIIPFEIGSPYTMKAGKCDITDLDNDGDLDIIVPSTGFYSIQPCDAYTLFWFENDGNFNFTPRSITCDKFEDVDEVIADDYDNDGDIDFIATSGCNPAILTWYENLGNTEFKYHFIEEIGGCNAIPLTKTDLDNDGNSDFILTKENSTFWYKNNGNANFEKKIISSDIGGDVTISDIDLDGDRDLIIAQKSSSKNIVLLKNNGNNKFLQTFVDENVSNEYTTSVYADDLDNDGDIDIISGSATNNTLSWHENDGEEIFRTHRIQHHSNSTVCLFGADVDNNNNIDILTASADGNISWIENNGNKFFTQHMIGKINEASGVLSLDLDNDNDLDIIGSGDFIAWYENNGFKRFTEHVITLNSADEVQAIDLDNDGDVDLITNPNRLYWYENDGNENFVEHEIASDNGTKSIFPVDINGDNKMDIICSYKYDRQIGVFINNGNKMFSEVLIPTNNWLEAVFPADIDSDGDIDIVCITSNSSSAVLVFENLGNLNFKEHIVSVDLEHPTKVSVGDVNLDGKNDIIVTCFYSQILWFENSGNLKFSKRIIAANSSYPIDTKPIDVDKDGDLDIVTSYEDEIIIFYNDLKILSAYQKEPFYNFKIFPNPNQGTFLIKSSEVSQITGTIMTVTNSMGQQVFSQPLTESSSYLEVNQPQGIYYVTIRNGAAVTTRRIVIL